MEIDLRLDEETLIELHQIARLSDRSLAGAVQIVLERYSKRCRGQIESAQKLADKINGKGN